MPTRPRTTREQILDEALSLVREQGIEALSARTLARRLGCSTQPVLYQFADMRALEEAVYRRADDFHTAYILRLTPDEDPLLQLGMNYIRFAREEPRLFRFLFQSDRFSGQSLEQLVADPAAEPLLTRFARGGDAEHARHMLLMLFVWVHGYACLISENQLDFDADTLRSLLSELFHRLEGEDQNDEAVQEE